MAPKKKSKPDEQSALELSVREELPDAAQKEKKEKKQKKEKKDKKETTHTTDEPDTEKHVKDKNKKDKTKKHEEHDVTKDVKEKEKTEKAKKTVGTVRDQTQKPENVVPSPVGLPPGWRAVEKEYISGQYAGQTYVRYFSDSHSSVSSVKKAIELHAKDTGQDLQVLLKEFDILKKREKEELAKTREEKGKFSKDRREQCIEVFRATHGQLNGPIVCAIPGWRGESKLLERCGQLCASYYDPKGTCFKLVKDIEAYFGNLMLQGKPEEVPDIAAARDSVKLDENGKPIHAARSENIVEEYTVPPKEKKNKRKREHSVVNDEWYRVVTHIRVLGCSAKLPDDVPAFDELNQDLKQIQKILVQRRFAKDTQIVYVLGRVPGCGVANRRILEGIQGFYYRMPENFNGRPCYQQIRATSVPDRLACTNMYLYFSALRTAWKCSPMLDDSKAALALFEEDASTPVDLNERWKIYEARQV
eukprot:TRINITY_DN4050_c0_g1_i1.p1 TRINITY_DN4050_c0_g1~~TRINITY_DN4050_c0_g1_i1.p1  ORF type:complete len:474 (+),score=86.54 TRINITY_DN4050_c0_g1_i1:147-1568(+)